MRRRFLVMVLASLLVTFVGCGAPGAQSLPTVVPTTTSLPSGGQGVCGGSTGPCTYTKSITYSGHGSAQTVHFTTGKPWVMVWKCVASVLGVDAPFRFTVTVMSTNSALSGSQPVNPVCNAPDNTLGQVGVQISDVQWLVIDTAHTDAPWTIIVLNT